MQVFESPLVLCMICAMIILHIISYFTHGIVPKILTYVNIALHIALIYPLISYGFKIDESVLLYMISFFVFVLVRFVGVRIEERRGKTDDI